MRDYGDRIQFLAIGSVDTADHIADFVSFYGLGDIPTAIDEDGSLRVSIGVPGHPSWGLIDEGGDATVVVGTVFRPRLIQMVEDLAAG